MTRAQKIMKKKVSIKAEMERQLTKKQSRYLWRKATRKLDEILNKVSENVIDIIKVTERCENFLVCDHQNRKSPYRAMDPEEFFSSVQK